MNVLGCFISFAPLMSSQLSGASAAVGMKGAKKCAKTYTACVALNFGIHWTIGEAVKTTWLLWDSFQQLPTFNTKGYNIRCRCRNIRWCPLRVCADMQLEVLASLHPAMPIEFAVQPPAAPEKECYKACQMNGSALPSSSRAQGSQSTEADKECGEHPWVWG